MIFQKYMDRRVANEDYKDWPGKGDASEMALIEFV